jgi:DNA mismatch endonuclease (patch repair protein)
MTDRVSKETRSRVMASVRSKNTKLEDRLVAILEGAEISGFVRYAHGLPGTPDIAFPKERVTVFLDSCFWHGCPKHLRRPSSNKPYWEEKIRKNIRRDRRQRVALRKLGWSVVRVWEHDLANAESISRRVSRMLKRWRMQEADRGDEP